MNDNGDETLRVAKQILEDSMRPATVPCPDCRGTGTVARANRTYWRCPRCHGVRLAVVKDR